MRGVLARGLVDVLPNRGMFVRDTPTSEALDIYDLRAALFGLAGRRPAERITQQQLQQLGLQLDEMDRLAAEGDLESYYRLNLGFHQFLVTQAATESWNRNT